MSTQSGPVYCASEAAIDAAVVAWWKTANNLAPVGPLTSALIAAHDPALGSDRSVCLRDVIEALDDYFHPQNPKNMHPADFVTKRFQGDGHEGLRYV